MVSEKITHEEKAGSLLAICQCHLFASVTGRPTAEEVV
jgi:hypothetical protein